MDVDGTHNANFQRLITLVRPLGTIAPGAVATISTCPITARPRREEEQDDEAAGRPPDRRGWCLEIPGPPAEIPADRDG